MKKRNNNGKKKYLNHGKIKIVKENNEIFNI
jgi:hypothetical protein